MADLSRGDFNNYELSQDLHLDKYAQHILDNGKSVAASTPTITTLTGSDFLQKLSATILNSIQLQTSLKQQAQQQQQFSEHTSSVITPIATTIATNMDFDMVPNHVVIDSSNFGDINDLQKQLEYDKFMNDVWIGIVMTLILISMVFCICSCFLYHQFRTWKTNYNATVAQSQTLDIESMKLNPELSDDPVPEYTLVSGLPTYEAALELLKKTPNSCVIVYPSVFSIFNKNEKMTNKLTDMAIQQQEQQQQSLTAIEVTTPLMASEFANAKCQLQSNNNSYNIQVPSYAEATAIANVTLTAVSKKSEAKKYARDTALAAAEVTASPNATTAATVLKKVPSSEEFLLVKNEKQ